MKKTPVQTQQNPPTPVPQRPATNPTSIPGIPGVPAFPQMLQPFQPIQAHYANGFESAITGADIVVTFRQNGRVLMTLNLSFTTAKALGRGLVEMVKDLESKSQTKVLFVEEVAESLGMSIGEKE